MRLHTIDIDVADADLVGFATGLTGAGPFLTFDATTPTDGLAHQVSIKSTTDVSDTTFTIVGTDANGKALTEAVVGPNATTVESTGYFLTISSVTASITLGAETIDLGWVDEVTSYIYPIDWRSPFANVVSVNVTGTLNFTVQETFANVLAGEAPFWMDITALASKTADTNGASSVGATAVRVILNSYSSAAELQVYTSQPTN